MNTATDKLIERMQKVSPTPNRGRKDEFNAIVSEAMLGLVAGKMSADEAARVERAAAAKLREGRTASPRTGEARKNLQEGIKKMDESLSPLSRALRKFNAGRPSKQEVDTPLGAVVLAVEQRERLAVLLAEVGVSLSRTIIVIEATLPGMGVPMQVWADVDAGCESSTVKFLEEHSQDGNSFGVSGLKFVVQGEGGHSVVDYAVNRTPEGRKALGECNVSHVRNHKKK